MWSRSGFNLLGVIRIAGVVVRGVVPLSIVFNAYHCSVAETDSMDAMSHHLGIRSARSDNNYHLVANRYA